jgi:hypothetical protein
LREEIKTPRGVISKKTNEVTYKHFEDTMRAWSTTLLKKVFADDRWIITPEKINLYSNKKPDLVVERLEGDKLVPVLIVELKKSGGDRLEKALLQTTEGLHDWMDDSGFIDVYVVVQRGLKIAFFEFHSNSDDVKKVVPSVYGCTSLTQSFLLEGIEQKVMDTIPDDLELLYHDAERLVNFGDKRKEALEYKIPCVFDLDKHEREIDFLFYHMSHKPPRQGPDPDDYPEDVDV